MISRRTSSVSEENVVFPRLLYCDSRCSKMLPGFSSVLPDLLPVLPGAPKFSPALRGVPNRLTITPMELLYQSSEIPGSLKAGRNALLGSDTLLKLTHLSLHSTCTQTLLEYSSDYNTFCWCRDILEHRYAAKQHLINSIWGTHKGDLERGMPEQRPTLDITRSTE